MRARPSQALIAALSCAEIRHSSNFSAVFTTYIRYIEHLCRLQLRTAQGRLQLIIKLGDKISEQNQNTHLRELSTWFNQSKQIDSARFTEY